MGEIRPPDEVIENPKKPTKSAIRPPDEVIVNPDKPTKSSVVEETPKKAKRKALDIWMGLVIFVAAIIELISWFMPQGNDYLLFWYPLFNSLTLVVFASFFLAKAFRYRSCTYTKIVSIGYTLLNVISLFAILLPNAKVITVLMVVYPILIVGIIVLLIIFFADYVINRTTLP